MKEHEEIESKNHEEDDSDYDEEIQDKIKDRIIKDTVEGLYVINKMLSSDTEDYKRLMKDTRVTSNIREELLKADRRRSKKSSQLSSNDDDESSDEEVDKSLLTTARETNTNKEALSKIVKEVKHKPLIRMLELNKTSMPIGDEPVYYNSDGEAVQMGLKSVDHGLRVRNQWGNRVSSRQLARNIGDESDSDNDLSRLSSRSRHECREISQSVLKKRKLPPVNSDDLQALDKPTEPPTSLKCAIGEKVDSKIERNSALSDANQLLSSCDFTTATLVMRDVLSKHMRQHHDALIEFIPTHGDGRRLLRGNLLPVTSISQCGGCGCTGTYS